MRPTPGKFTNPSALIDKRVGNHYAALENVNLNLDKIAHLSYYMESLFNLDRNLELLSDENVDHHILKDVTVFQGPSAYELAVKNGFEGTEVEWLASLHGAQGVADTSVLNGIFEDITANQVSLASVLVAVNANTTTFSDYATAAEMDLLETSLRADIPTVAEIDVQISTVVDASADVSNQALEAAEGRINAAELLITELRGDLDDGTASFDSFLVSNDNVVARLDVSEATLGEHTSQLVDLSTVTADLVTNQTNLLSYSDTSSSSITNLQTASADAAANIATLQTENATNVASIVSIQQVNADTATDILALQASDIDSAALITNLQTLTADQALSVTALEVTTADNQASIAGVQQVTSDNASLIVSLQAESATAASNIVTLNAVQDDHAVVLNTLSTTSGNQSSSISTLNTTTANQAISITNIESDLSDPVTGLDAKASISYVDSAITDEEGSRVTAIDELSTSFVSSQVASQVSLVHSPMFMEYYTGYNVSPTSTTDLNNYSYATQGSGYIDIAGYNWIIAKGMYEIDPYAVYETTIDLEYIDDAQSQTYVLLYACTEAGSTVPPGSEYVRCITPAGYHAAGRKKIVFRHSADPAKEADLVAWNNAKNGTTFQAHQATDTITPGSYWRPAMLPRYAGNSSDTEVCRVHGMSVKDVTHEWNNDIIVTEVATKATITYVDSAISNEAGSRASALTQIATDYIAADTVLQGSIDTKASITYVDDAVSGAEGSFASSFSDMTAAYQAADVVVTDAFEAADIVLQADIDTRSTITQLNTAVSDATSARGTMLTDITTAYQAADAALQTDIDTRATVSALSTAVSDATSARATLLTDITTNYTADIDALNNTLQTDIDTRATSSQLSTAVSDASSARTTLSANLTASYEAADAGLQSDIDTRATVSQLNTAVSDATSARATLSTDLTADFTAADGVLQGDIDTKAAITYVDSVITTEQGARASAVNDIEAAYKNADNLRIGSALNADPEQLSSTLNWSITGSGVTSFQRDRDDASGGSCVVASGGMATWLGDDIIPVDTSQTYELRLRGRQNTNPGGYAFWAGVQCLDKDGVHIPRTGGGTYNYFVNEGTYPSTNWKDYYGTIGDEDASADYDTFEPGTAFVRLLLITNYQTGTGEFELDSASFNQVQVSVMDARARLTTAETAIVDNNSATVVSLQAMETAYEAADDALQLDIDTRATITQLNTAVSDASGARSALSTTLTAAYEAADSSLQTDIDTRATTVQLNTAVSDASSARGTLLSDITTAYEAGDALLQTDIDTRATSAQLSTAVSDAASARSTLSTDLTTAFEADDAALQTDIDTRATVTQLNTAVSDASSARSSLSTVLTAAYEAADDTLQNDIDTRATSVELNTAVSDASSARSTLSADLTTAFEAADSNLQTDINTRATTSQLNTAISDASSARSTLSTNLTAAYEGGDNILGGRIDSTESNISSIQTSITNGTIASATDLQELRTELVTADAVSRGPELNRDPNQTDLSQWVTSGSGSGIVTQEDVADALGGSVIQVAGYRFIYGDEYIAVNEDKTYEVLFRARQTVDDTGSQFMYAGVACYDKDKNLLVNNGGAGTYHYCACPGYALTSNWVDYFGTMDNSLPQTSASTFQPGTRYVRTLAYVNYNSGTGTAEIDRVAITELSEAQTTATADIEANSYALSDPSGSVALMESSVRADFAAADSALQADVDTKAAVTYVDSAITSEQGARATAISTVSSSFASADDSLESDINDRAAVNVGMGSYPMLLEQFTTSYQGSAESSAPLTEGPLYTKQLSYIGVTDYSWLRCRGYIPINDGAVYEATVRAHHPDATGDRVYILVYAYDKFFNRISTDYCYIVTPAGWNDNEADFKFRWSNDTSKRTDLEDWADAWYGEAISSIGAADTLSSDAVYWRFGFLGNYVNRTSGNECRVMSIDLKDVTIEYEGVLSDRTIDLSGRTAVTESEISSIQTSISDGTIALGTDISEIKAKFARDAATGSSGTLSMSNKYEFASGVSNTIDYAPTVADSYVEDTVYGPSWFYEGYSYVASADAIKVEPDGTYDFNVRHLVTADNTGAAGKVYVGFYQYNLDRTSRSGTALGSTSPEITAADGLQVHEWTATVDSGTHWVKPYIYVNFPNEGRNHKHHVLSFGWDNVTKATVAEANAQTAITAVATETGARVSAINTLTSTVGGNTASITDNSTAITGLDNFAESTRTIGVDVNGVGTGIVARAASDGSLTTTDLLFYGDQLRHTVGGDAIWESNANGMLIHKTLYFVAGTGLTKTMLVFGLGFGADDDLVEWFGPFSASTDTCTKLNGVRAKTIDGKTYLNGAQEGIGVLTATDSDESTALLESQASNGNDVQVSCGASAEFSETVSNTSSAAPWGAPAIPTLTFQLERKIDAGSWTVAHTAPSASGTSYSTSEESPSFSETGLYIHKRGWAVSSAINYTQPGSASTSTTYGWRVTRTATSWSPTEDNKTVSVSTLEGTT